MSADTATLPRRKFTVDEYHRFIEHGVFKPEERIELWDGGFVEMSLIRKRHASCVAALTALFNHLFYGKLIIWAQNPIILDDFSEPQPDICLLK